jgi:hypothetical protein
MLIQDKLSDNIQSMCLIRSLLTAGILLFLIQDPVYSQSSPIMVYGYILDELGGPVPLANISISGTPLGTISNDKGEYVLSAPAKKEFEVVVSLLGYESSSGIIKVSGSESIRRDFVIRMAYEDISEVYIYHGRVRQGSLSRLDTRPLEHLPSVGGEIESLLKTMPGVSGRNEFSSRYSVRGGNYDENLVYVNGIEIHRPFLIRSGQQEGLSFVNPDMVGTIHFSAGGFSARYGDKMSSVLDITYREPTTFAASASASLLGASAHAEGVTPGGRFNFISGIRYKTNQYLLQSMDEKGDFSISFIDFQSHANFHASENLTISFLGNYSGNNYGFTPTTRETSFGTFDNPLQMMVFFEGRENSLFETVSAAISSHYATVSGLNLKFTASGFSTRETELFDIRGRYSINQIARHFSNSGDSIMNIGTGVFLNHARNQLESGILSLSHQGDVSLGRNQAEWGFRYDHQRADDHLREWQALDSAGYNLPYSGNEIITWHLMDSENNLGINLLAAYLQNTTRFSPGSIHIDFTAGMRMTYFSFNSNLKVSPRSSLTIYPANRNDLVFHLSGGYYYQPPFYRELRDHTGKINPGKKPQRSVHLVAGTDYFLELWERPFKLSTEIYFKWLSDLIPFTIDNIRNRYAADNSAKGYATGFDVKLHGDFVRGIDSWLSLSLLQTRESVASSDTETGAFTPYYPRPTDQLVNFSFFFQDYLPGNPGYKIHMKLAFASRLPFSPPNSNPHEVIFRMPSYRRVDLGFSKEISQRLKDPGKGHVPGNFRSLWIGAEIFNLLDIKNTASYFCLKTISSDPSVPGQFAIPGYLSGRRIDIKLTARF